MKIENTIIIAYRNIIKNKVRSFLTMLGIIIGVFSVIIMVGIGEGTQKKIEKEISSLGTNLIMIYPASTRSGGVSQGSGTVNKLTVKDADLLKEKVTGISYVSPYVTSNSQIIGNGNNWNTSINGVSDDYFYIKDYKMESGEFITEQNIKSSKNCAIIGKTIVDNIFPDTNPIGQKLRIGKIPFIVTGVIASKGTSGNGQDQDDMVLIPYTTMMNKVSGSRYLRTIYVSTESKDVIDSVQTGITDVLRASHKLTGNTASDFNVRSQSELVERAASVTGLMTMLLGSIAGVSLLVGGIGIMNIMLVSVTERTREIGTRLAIGARGNDILLQFLIEAFVLSLSGGFVGILISVIIAVIFNTFTSIILVININIVIISVLFSGGVGVFFGYYPARKASMMNPIDALRFE